MQMLTVMTAEEEHHLKMLAVCLSVHNSYTILLLFLHLEMHACDWSNSHHVAVNKSR